ncbi:DUF4345 domain-containing protein [Vibrio sp. HN007]|uniref:DUF4345 domain-containing protein n=1 Tax=Vibrio iocasae TaxID=3098914 RepID=UPI0035D401FA
MSKFQKIILGLSGFIAFIIGSSIALTPLAFYAGYGITLDSDPNLLSELRAPGANLAALGAVIVSGLFIKSLEKSAIAIALVIFLAFPIGRVVGIVADGVPSESVLLALAIEIVMGALLLTAFGKRSNTSKLTKTTSA